VSNNKDIIYIDEDKARVENRFELSIDHILERSRRVA